MLTSVFRRFSAVPLTLGILALCAPCEAGIIFDIGNNPEPNEENVLFGDQLGTNPIFGTTNQTDLAVRFSSALDTSLLTPSSGQARIESGDGLVNSVLIDLPGGTFTDLIFNAFNGTGTANITVTPVGESDVNFSYDLGNGQNFLTILAIDGQLIESVRIDAASGFADLRQVRISGASLDIDVNEVPEPSSLVLLSLGLMGSAAGLRFRRGRSVA